MLNINDVVIALLEFNVSKDWTQALNVSKDFLVTFESTGTKAYFRARACGALLEKTGLREPSDGTSFLVLTIEC